MLSKLAAFAIGPRNEYKDIKKSLTDCVFDQLLLVAPDVSFNSGYESGSDKLIETTRAGSDDSFSHHQGPAAVRACEQETSVDIHHQQDAADTEE